MPAPAVLLVAAGITAVASNPAFIRFVYDPLIAPTLERLAENYVEQRRARSRRPALVDRLPRPGADGRNDNDIPLNGMRRRSTGPSTSYRNENDDGDEELGLIMVQTSATAISTEENAAANITLRRRPVAAIPFLDDAILKESLLPFGAQSCTTANAPNENVDANAAVHSVVAVPVVDNTIYEESPTVQSSTTATEPDESFDADTTLHRRPAAVLVDSTTHEESSLLLGVQSSTPAREPNVNENINSSATLCRRPVSVDNNNKCRVGSKRATLVPAQLRPEHAVPVSGLSRPAVPEWKTTVFQDPLRPHEERRRKDQVQWMSSVVDRPPLPSSVPSTPSATTPSMVFTPHSQLSPLFSGSTSPSVGADGPNPSETRVLNPRDGVSSHSPPRLPPLPTLSPLCVPSISLSLSTHSTHSNQLTSSTSHQSLNTSPHLPLSAQSLDCGHLPAPPNATTVASSEIYHKHQFSSPGVMSSELSELDFISA